MKKILILATCFALSFSTVQAQEEDDALKQFQFGFSAGLAMKFLDTEFTNYLDRPGIGAGFNGGVVFNYHFNDRVAFSSGLLFDLESFRTEYAVREGEIGPFYGYRDKDILKSDDLTNADGLFLLQERKNSLNYLSVPLNIRLQTNKIGFMRYFGKLGVKADFLLQRRVSDTGIDIDLESGTPDLLDLLSNSSVTQEKMNSTGHFQFMRSAFTAAAGAEWFFSGNTALTAELEYNYGFTNIYRGSSKSVYYYDVADLTTQQELEIKANMHQFLIKVGIMF